MTQVERISKYLDDFGSITPLQALTDLGIMRLAARISDMKASGAKIVSETVRDTNRYGQVVHYTRYKKAV